MIDSRNMRGWLYAAMLTFAGLALTSPAMASQSAWVVSDDSVTVKLRPERQAKASESVWLQVTAGALDGSVSIVIKSANGAYLGTVSPFGAQARATGGSYLIALPDDMAGELPICINFQVDSGGNKGNRAPTKDELLDVELVFVPTSK